MIGFILLAVVFVVIPGSEIAAFIVVGGEIGVLSTLIITVLTAVAGTYLLRRQGFSIVRKIRSEVEAERIPGNEMVHGAMVMLAGLLLLIPGFVTDTTGFLLFVPAVRRFIWGLLAKRIKWSDVEFERRTKSRSGGGVVDLEEEEWEMKAEGTANFTTDGDDDDTNKKIEQKVD